MWEEICSWLIIIALICGSIFIVASMAIIVITRTVIKKCEEQFDKVDEKFNKKG